MYPEYTHILVITVKQLAINGEIVAAPEQNGMMYDYSLYLKVEDQGASTCDPKIKQVFYYSDSFLCLVTLDSTFTDMPMDAKTIAFEPMVLSLFNGADKVKFSWMLRAKDDVVNAPSSPVIKPSDGSSGGSNF